jgi:hypothetical protein
MQHRHTKNVSIDHTTNASFDHTTNACNALGWLTALPPPPGIVCPTIGMSAPKSANVGLIVGIRLGANDGAGVGENEGPIVGLFVG